jgi:hypothetical protein
MGVLNVQRCKRLTLDRLVDILDQLNGYTFPSECVIYSL